MVVMLRVVAVIEWVMVEAVDCKEIVPSFRQFCTIPVKVRVVKVIEYPFAY